MTGDIICIDDEISFNLPNGWVWCRLNNLSEIVRGGSPRPAGSPEYYDGKIPFLKVADLTKDNCMYVTSHTATIKEAGLKKTREVSANTLLLTNSGATLGVPKICTFKTTFNDGIAAFLYLSEELKPFVYWFLSAMTETFRKINQGTAQPNLNTDIIKRTLFAMPPLNEQKRIIERIEEISPIIDEYSHAQQNLSALNDSLFEKLKKSILNEAIKGRLVQQDDNGESASVLLQRIKNEKLELTRKGVLKKKDVIDSVIYRGDDNKYYEQKGKENVCIDDEIPFRVPESWSWARLGSIADIYTGNSISESEKQSKYTNVNGRYYIGTKDVGFDGQIYYDNGVSIPHNYEKDFRIAVANSVLMCIEGGSAGRKIAILNQDVHFGNKLCCFTPYAEISKFLYYYLQSPIFIDMFNGSKTGIIGGVSIKKIMNLLIPIPPFSEMQRIWKRIDSIIQILN